MSAERRAAEATAVKVLARSAVSAIDRLLAIPGVLDPEEREQLEAAQRVVERFQR